jgi:hypothetical protein
MQIRRVLALCVALVLLVAAGPALAQRIADQKKQPKRSKAEQQDIQTLVKAVDGVSAGQPAPADIPVQWVHNDFVKGQGGVTYIPYTLNIDRSKLASPMTALYVRVVNKNAPALAPAAPAADSKDKGKDKDKNAAAAPVPQYAWNNIQFVDVPEDGRLSRALQLEPGDYDFYIAVKDKSADEKAAAAPAKIGILHREVKVPDFNAPELTTSTVILATSIQPLASPLKPEEQQENPYVFGPMKIVPSIDAKFAKSGDLNVVFWIYGAADAGNGKPDVQVEYNFYQKMGDTEKYFNKTAPQALNAQTLPPEFNTAAGHQLPGSLAVPLMSFPAGDYRLEIKVTDKKSGKATTQSVTFSVA